MIFSPWVTFIFNTTYMILSFYIKLWFIRTIKNCIFKNWPMHVSMCQPFNKRWTVRECLIYNLHNKLIKTWKYLERHLSYYLSFLNHLDSGESMTWQWHAESLESWCWCYAHRFLTFNRRLIITLYCHWLAQNQFKNL